MSGTVTLRGIHVGFGAQPVLAGVDLVVGPGDRVGVVAPNGVGKSTLLRVLAGELAPESGVVVRAPTSTAVVRLEQEPVGRPEDSLFAHLARRTGVAAAHAPWVSPPPRSRPASPAPPTRTPRLWTPGSPSAAPTSTSVPPP
jgi:ATPase subunit of ABC transporter with duplicated ATPase domains